MVMEHQTCGPTKLCHLAFELPLERLKEKGQLSTEMKTFDFQLEVELDEYQLRMSQKMWGQNLIDEN